MENHDNGTVNLKLFTKSFLFVNLDSSLRLKEKIIKQRHIKD